MKKNFIFGLTILLIIVIFSCGRNSNEEVNKTEDQNNQSPEGTSELLELGQSIDCDFGSFSITGFKRDGDVLYYSIQINPKNSGSNNVELKNLECYIGETPTKLNITDIQLQGTPYQGLYSINSDKVGEINAISLDYNGVQGKWSLDLNANSAGDVNYIDTTLAQLKAQQEQQRQQQEQAKAAEEEKNNVAYAWQAVAEYGESMYPYGFKLHYIMDKLAEEKQSDGTWFLKAGCDVTNMYNAKMSGVCEAVVQGSGQNWTVLSFNVY